MFFKVSLLSLIKFFIEEFVSHFVALLPYNNPSFRETVQTVHSYHDRGSSYFSHNVVDSSLQKSLRFKAWQFLLHHPHRDLQWGKSSAVTWSRCLGNRETHGISKKEISDRTGLISELGICTDFSLYLYRSFTRFWIEQVTPFCSFYTPRAFKSHFFRVNHRVIATTILTRLWSFFT